MYLEKEELEELKVIFRNNGFSEDQIGRALNGYKDYYKHTSEIRKSLPLLIKQVLDLGYNVNEAIELAIMYPKRLYSKIKLNETNINSLEAIHNRDILVDSGEIRKYDNAARNIAFLRKYGFSEKKLDTWKKSKKIFLFQDFQRTYDAIMYFIVNFCYTKERVIKEFSKKPSLFTTDVDVLTDKIPSYKSVGFSNYEIGVLLGESKNSAEYTSMQFENIIKWFKTREISNNTIKKAIMKNPSIISKSESILTDAYNFFISYGFSSDDMDGIICGCHSIFSTSISLLNDKLKVLETYGYEKKEIIDIIIKFPAYLALSLKTINIKLSYLKEIELLDVFVANPKNLIQSKELTELRYDYLKEEEQDVDVIKNYLCTSEAYFKKRYGLSKEDLINNRRNNS